LKPSDASSVLPSLPQGAEILIVRPRSLGDIVLETPAITALHAWRPDLRIFLLIEERFVAALAGNPAVAGFIFSRGFLETSRDMRRRNLAVVFNQHGGPRSVLLTAASGAPWRVGWKGFQYAVLYNVLVPDAGEFYGTPTVHTVEHRMSQFYWTGLPRGPMPPARVYPQAKAIERVSTLLAETAVSGAYAVLQPEARTLEMRWPLEKFAEIARWLRDKHGIKSVVNLSGRHMEEPAETRAILGKDTVIPAALPLPDLIALVSRARIFIGNDSGPAHLAAATGTPAVVMYGPTNPAKWHPWQLPHRVVATGAEFRAIRGDKSIAIREPRAIGAISVDEVRAACEELWTQARVSDFRGNREG
jgi:lipopolysaccharide heptosyltransferase III